MSEERRENRSDNIYKALELQLSATARRARFSALVLTEDQGLTVAASGDVDKVEEIAVLSPKLAPGSRFWQGNIRSSDGSNRSVTVAPVETGAGHLYLCALGNVSATAIAELQLSGRGIDRILA